MAAVNWDPFELDVRVYNFFLGLASSFSSSVPNTPSMFTREDFEDFLPSSKVSFEEDWRGESVRSPFSRGGGP